MKIENCNLSDWLEVRYQIVYETGRVGGYSAWDIVRFYDEGYINEETIVSTGVEETVLEKNSWSTKIVDRRLGDSPVFRGRDLLRGFGNLGQASIVVELEKLNGRIKGISLGLGLIMLGLLLK
jgi:hypothetical protein